VEAWAGAGRGAALRWRQEGGGGSSAAPPIASPASIAAAASSVLAGLGREVLAIGSFAGIGGATEGVGGGGGGPTSRKGGRKMASKRPNATSPFIIGPYIKRLQPEPSNSTPSTLNPI